MSECGHCGGYVKRIGYRVCKLCGHRTHQGCISECWNSEVNFAKQVAQAAQAARLVS